jgi:uncharacterized protein (TIGR02145 family)
MKSPCAINATDPDGTSKTVLQGGFSVLLAGDAFGSSTSSFGDYAYFWSSSSYNNNAWYRYLSYGLATANRNGGARGNLMSVRCKK